MRHADIQTLRARLDGNSKARLGAASAGASWRDIAGETLFRLAPLRGRSVLLFTREQFAAARVLVDLDGVAARIVIAPPDLDAAMLPSIIARAEIDTVVTDFALAMPEDVVYVHLPREAAPLPALPPVRTALRRHTDPPLPPVEPVRTEWVLFTSGTTGEPKMAVHDIGTLTGAISPDRAEGTVWGTFYDIRRYGGLQIFLRAALGGAALALSEPGEDVGVHLLRLGRAGVTHLTGTPSHWRRALMSSALRAISPRYIRLSGEIADQAILDALARTFPDAAIGHAYASTEAGVGFEVDDGRAGFPASLLDREVEVRMKVEDDVLKIRSPRAARRFIGLDSVFDAQGFVDSGDMVERHGDRYHFAGRRGGIINVGGLKIHPEEVESVINRQAGVRLCRVSARRSPITGAIVVAEVVLSAGADPDAARPTILEACRANLAPFKVPATLRFVESLDLTAGGKLARAHA